MGKPVALMLLLILGIISAKSQENKPIKSNHLNLEKGIAIQGYDPVSYFTDTKPREGNKKYSVNHNGATYYFLTEKNQAAFKQNPSKYTPAYGGWCAYAMGAKGEKVEIDPETYKITNGRLYLFYNRFFNNTLPLWNKDEVSLSVKADQYWQNMIK